MQARRARGSAKNERMLATGAELQYSDSDAKVHIEAAETIWGLGISNGGLFPETMSLSLWFEDAGDSRRAAAAHLR